MGPGSCVRLSECALHQSDKHACHMFIGTLVSGRVGKRDQGIEGSA
jgi:hypothetical protein